jgi:ribokinase
MVQPDLEGLSGMAKAVCVLGGINWDVVAHVADLPRPGETIHGLGLSQSAGGKGLNQAVAAARFGAATLMLGAVGADAAGAALTAYLTRAGVDARQLLTDPAVPTGQAQILLAASGENMIVVTAGANMAFGAAEVEAADIAAAGVFVTQFEARPDAIAALFRRPEARAGLKILNAAPAMVEHRALLDLADIVLVNAAELARFAGLAEAPGDAAGLAAAARTLITGSGRTVVITLGGRGGLAVDAGTAVGFDGLPAHVVDTVGAGDCFCGVLAAALAEGRPLADALAWANAAAALSVGRKGAADSSPLRAEVEALLGR